ncbi:MAG TPA: hypothetical protein VHW90_02000 [Stellaceae bacterium]|jgi:hypothetical protein|nr:hypothetical protein [Stellaceae bacterium]
MTATDPPPPGGKPTPAIAAAEADIAATRQQLDATLAALRRDYALPLAAVSGISALLDGTADAKQVKAWALRNVPALALVGLGAGWFALQNRGPLRQLGNGYAGDLIGRARAFGIAAAGGAINSALEKFMRPRPDIAKDPPPFQDQIRPEP